MSREATAFVRVSHPHFPVEPEKPLNRQWIVDAERLQERDLGKTTSPFNLNKLRTLIELNDHDTREKLYELFKEPIFHHRYGETLQQERARTMLRWKRIAEVGFFKDTIAAGTSAGLAKYEAIIESVGFLDHSLDIKMSVHYGLFGATVALLGSQAQAERWLPLIESCKMLGCFALTVRTEMMSCTNAHGIFVSMRGEKK